MEDKNKKLIIKVLFFIFIIFLLIYFGNKEDEPKIQVKDDEVEIDKKETLGSISYGLEKDSFMNSIDIENVMNESIEHIKNNEYKKYEELLGKEIRETDYQNFMLDFIYLFDAEIVGLNALYSDDRGHVGEYHLKLFNPLNEKILLEVKLYQNFIKEDENWKISQVGYEMEMLKHGDDVEFNNKDLIINLSDEDMSKIKNEKLVIEKEKEILLVKEKIETERKNEEEKIRENEKLERKKEQEEREKESVELAEIERKYEEDILLRKKSDDLEIRVQAKVEDVVGKDGIRDIEFHDWSDGKYSVHVRVHQDVGLSLNWYKDVMLQNCVDLMKELFGEKEIVNIVFFWVTGEGDDMIMKTTISRENFESHETILKDEVPFAVDDYWVNSSLDNVEDK
jgi:hypothetical protein